MSIDDLAGHFGGTSMKCSNCQITLGKKNITGLCSPCRVKKWHFEHRERVNEIKKKYAVKNKEKRKISLRSYANKPSTKANKHNWYILNQKNTQCPDCKKIIYYKSTYCASCFQKGDKASNWQGGLTLMTRLLRSQALARNWAIKIKKRDDYTCQFCKKRGGFLHSDHIKPWALYPELRYDLSNGRTLCKDCHYKTETFGGRKIYAENLGNNINL